MCPFRPLQALYSTSDSMHVIVIYAQSKCKFEYCVTWWDFHWEFLEVSRRFWFFKKETNIKQTYVKNTQDYFKILFCLWSVDWKIFYKIIWSICLICYEYFCSSLHTRNKKIELSIRKKTLNDNIFSDFLIEIFNRIFYVSPEVGINLNATTI